MPDYDVIVAGAGPVGMLAACLLAARGLQVMICDRRYGVDERNRAIGVHPPGLAALDAAGVGRDVREEALHLAGGEVHARGRMLASVAFGDRHPVLILPQRRTDALLRARLRVLGVVVRGSQDVTGVQQEESHVVVRTRASEGSGSDAMRESTASFLVAADGVRSALRESLGIGWLPRPGRARHSMIDLSDGDDAPVARLFCEPAGLVESFPLPRGMRRWVLRHADEDLPAGSFADEVHERTGVRPEVGDEMPVSFLAAQHRAARVVVGRVVLLGDAAHEVSPIGGQGMNLGWADARRLTEALAAAVGGGHARLPGYEARCVRAAADVHRRARFYMSMGSPAGPVAQRAREGAIRMLGAPLLRRAAAALVTMGGIG